MSLSVIPFLAYMSSEMLIIFFLAFSYLVDANLERYCIGLLIYVRYFSYVMFMLLSCFFSSPTASDLNRIRLTESCNELIL